MNVPAAARLDGPATAPARASVETGPFGLSLSKHLSFSFCTMVEEGRGFDRLSPNGIMAHRGS